MRTPSPFDLDLTVRSHGFYDLPPWVYSADRRLRRPLRLASGKIVVAEVAPAPDGLALRIRAEGQPSSADVADATRQVRRCLALDEDLAPFHSRILEVAAAPPRGVAGRCPDLRWAASRGAGRLLRSPTVFEDAVKTLCTTNCTWALTRTMVGNLVQHLGARAPGEERAFPTPEAMAARPETFFREVIRAGYRAGALRWIAVEAASGRLDMERWRDPSQAVETLAAEIQALPGFGPYATEHLLRLLGRYDHLALDSWTRATLARLRGARRVPADRTIRRWYAPYGRFAGLAMWLEATADWYGAEPGWRP